jgi:hypothetical protein
MLAFELRAQLLRQALPIGHALAPEQRQLVRAAVRLAKDRDSGRVRTATRHADEHRRHERTQLRAQLRLLEQQPDDAAHQKNSR